MFFFFQAEDGIRDLTVTGVQTCALPIYATRTSIRTPRNVVTFTRNWAQILVDGRPVLLDGPVRIKTGVWLVPESFVTAILPRLTPSPSALPRAATSVTLDELRLRSYPSFTRVVLETSGPAPYRAELTGPKEARIRLVGLVGNARAEGLAQGRIKIGRAHV